MIIDDSNLPESTAKNMVPQIVEERSSQTTPEEHALLLLATWNATRQPYPRDLYVPHLISQQARATPDALALTADGKELSYRELDRRANQVAHYLKKSDMEPAALVGICLPRSLDLVVGLLGILKAGCAYLPLDPAYPLERKSFMLKDSHVSVLLTSQALLNTLPLEGETILCLDRDIQLQPEDEPAIVLAPDKRAYVIYTSGSTGKPKGVEISHTNLLNLIYWHRRAYGITAADRATQITSPAFDATGWELWPYLTTGASVHFLSEEVRVSPQLLYDWLLEQQISISFLPTALAETMLEFPWPAEARLRYLLTGADMLQRYPRTGLPFAFVNNYGPTEATVVATYGVVTPDEHPVRFPSIGRPIDNTQIYLLDEELRRVSPGEPGELYIGGDGVAIGYLHRPELTRERFIADPFSKTPGARLYKTGDRARYLPDGQIAFLGRNDYQIKLRGYRIEPNEIANALNSQPAIQSSVVVASSERTGEKELVAYLVLDPAQNVLVREIKAMLSLALPDYMIPTTYVVLAALPVTSNGKIDRTNLPEPDEKNMLQDEVRSTPATPLEEQLEKIVASLLGLEHVGVEDNFFMLGGHSLLGTQIIARIKTTFGVNLALRTLFESPTVRSLAASVEELIMEKLLAMSEDEARQLLK
ncbi:MAG TPA: amino acid adenylation domain-containing protein [Ktedonobacteraceae bacterium]